MWSREGEGGSDNGSQRRSWWRIMVQVRVRRLKGAALAVVRTLAVAAAIALIMLLVAVLGGLILIAVDELFN